MDETRTLIDAAVDHLREAAILDVKDDVIAISCPAGTTVDLKDLEEYRPEPKRIRQVSTFETPSDFADYVNDFKDARTRIFASLEQRKVVATIDYHAKGDDAVTEHPSWRTHKATYPAAFAPAFNAWHTAHGRPIPQKVFAQWLEDRAEDAVKPEPADLMEVASKFEAVRNVNFISALNVNTGERAFKYEEKDAPAGAITVPKAILLRTPVFQGCEPVQWAARLAYDINGGALSFTVKIHRLDELLDSEFNRLCLTISEQCDVPLHRGVAL